DLFCKFIEEGTLSLHNEQTRRSKDIYAIPTNPPDRYRHLSLFIATYCLYRPAISPLPSSSIISKHLPRHPARSFLRQAFLPRTLLAFNASGPGCTHTPW